MRLAGTGVDLQAPTPPQKKYKNIMRLAGTGGVLQASYDAEVKREGSAGEGGRDLEDIAYASLLARADTRGHKFKVLSLLCFTRIFFEK